MIEALIFDLDDTLYVEGDFVASGYRAVAHHIALRYSLPEDRVFDEMMATFDAQGREKVLVAAKDRFMDSSVSVAELVDVYRGHSPTIQLLPGYAELLERLRDDFKMGIVTDGLPEVQKRKIQALRLEEMMDSIVYTWEYGPEREKPHPFGFGLMLATLGTSPSNALYIGDNPDKDCRGAHGAGLQFVQVVARANTEEAATVIPNERADFAINNLHELPGILQLSR